MNLIPMTLSGLEAEFLKPVFYHPYFHPPSFSPIVVKKCTLDPHWNPAHDLLFLKAMQLKDLRSLHWKLRSDTKVGELNPVQTACLGHLGSSVCASCDKAFQKRLRELFPDPDVEVIPGSQEGRIPMSELGLGLVWEGWLLF